MIQYNHTIGTAASSYSWENVYSYDKEFRMHMQQFPSRNWSVTLQQAWTMILKDHNKYSDNNHRAGNSSWQNGKKEICKRFNQGKNYCRNVMSLQSLLFRVWKVWAWSSYLQEETGENKSRKNCSRWHKFSGGHPKSYSKR